MSSTDPWKPEPNLDDEDDDPDAEFAVDADEPDLHVASAIGPISNDGAAAYVDLMDTLQQLGLDPVQATRFVCSIKKN